MFKAAIAIVAAVVVVQVFAGAALGHKAEQLATAHQAAIEAATK